MRALWPCLCALSCACSLLQPEDEQRAVTVTVIQYWTGGAIVDAVVHACPDDGQIHADWGESCAVASGTPDFEGRLRLDGLGAEAYQIYVDGSEPWSDHATLISLVAESSAVEVELYQSSVAEVTAIGDYQFSAPAIPLLVGPAADCGSNQFVLDLPGFDAHQLTGDAATCIEYDNNDFTGLAAYDEQDPRPASADECDGAWCESWTVVSRTQRRLGTFNAVLQFEDKEIQADGRWLD